MAAYVPGAISGIFQADSVVADALFSKPVAESIPSAAPKVEIVPFAKNQKAAKETTQAKPGEDSKKKSKKSKEPERKSNPEQDSRTLFVGNIPIKRDYEPVDTASERDGAEGGEDAQPPALKEINKNKLLKRLEKRVRAHFSQFGQIESVRFRGLGITKVKVESGTKFSQMRRVAAIKNSLDERVDSCIGYIVFKSVDGVDLAISTAGKKGLEFEGNHLRLDKLKEPLAVKNEDGSNTEVEGKEAVTAHKGTIFERKKTVFVGGLMFECSDEEVRAHFDKELHDEVPEGGDKPVVSVRIIRDPKTNLGKGFAYVLLSDAELVNKAVTICDGQMIRTRAIRVSKCERSSQKKDEKNAKKREADEMAEAKGLPKSGAEERLQKKQRIEESKKNKKNARKSGGGAPKQTKKNKQPPTAGSEAKKKKTNKSDSTAKAKKVKVSSE